MAKRKKQPAKPRGPKGSPLTFRQRLFVVYYLGEAGGNASEAARMAGYAEPRQEGSRLLTNADIRAAIDAKLDKAALSADEVLARLSEMATGDISDFISVNAAGGFTLDLAKALKAGKLHLVKKIKQTRFGPVLELYDALAALEKLGRYHGLFQDRVEARIVDDKGSILERILDPSLPSGDEAAGDRCG